MNVAIGRPRIGIAGPLASNRLREVYGIVLEDSDRLDNGLQDKSISRTIYGRQFPTGNRRYWPALETSRNGTGYASKGLFWTYIT